jgi:hypothetical protein
MNRKLMVWLFLVVNAMVALSLSRNHAQNGRLTSVTVDDGTQPPVPPPGRTKVALLDDGTQPPVPPPGVAVLIADGTQPPVPPPGRTLETAVAPTRM